MHAHTQTHLECMNKSIAFQARCICESGGLGPAGGLQQWSWKENDSNGILTPLAWLLRYPFYLYVPSHFSGFPPCTLDLLPKDSVMPSKLKEHLNGNTEFRDLPGHFPEFGFFQTRFMTKAHAMCQQWVFLQFSANQFYVSLREVGLNGLWFL